MPFHTEKSRARSKTAIKRVAVKVKKFIKGFSADKKKKNIKKIAVAGASGKSIKKLSLGLIKTRKSQLTIKKAIFSMNLATYIF